MNLKVDKALIEKYLAGTCNEEELLQVRHFLKEENSQQLFNEVWDEQWGDKIKANIRTADDEQIAVWKNTFLGMVSERFPAEDKAPVPFFKKIGTWKYAAIWIALIVGIGFFYVNLTKKPKETVLAFEERYNPNGTRTKIILPDSSQVYLGAGSRLRYAVRFSGNTREIDLEGEAFFEVTKNPKKPFIIHTGNVTTKVLGTSFKITAFVNKPITVLVSTGKVRVDRHLSNQTESIAVLTPGQTVTWNEKKQEKVLGTAVVSDITGWKDGLLVFNETRLSEITEILERWYNVKIEFQNKRTAHKLMRVNLTANVPVNTLMKILSVSGQFKFHIRGNHITII
jgi:transmembrane sensor